jgi:hypothetical protein
MPMLLDSGIDVVDFWAMNSTLCVASGLGVDGAVARQGLLHLGFCLPS